MLSTPWESDFTLVRNEWSTDLDLAGGRCIMVRRLPVAMHAHISTVRLDKPDVAGRLRRNATSFFNSEFIASHQMKNKKWQNFLWNVMHCFTPKWLYGKWSILRPDFAFISSFCSVHARHTLRAPYSALQRQPARTTSFSCSLFNRLNAGAQHCASLASKTQKNKIC